MKRLFFGTVELAAGGVLGHAVVVEFIVRGCDAMIGDFSLGSAPCSSSKRKASAQFLYPHTSTVAEGPRSSYVLHAQWHCVHEVDVEF
jgi:hypothetical protein